MLRPEHLHTFCVVARMGSISRAAEELESNQPTLSRQLQHLQRATGSSLYRRTAYGISLTAYGEALLPYACALSQAWLAARRFIDEGDSLASAPLRIGLSYHLVPHYTEVVLHCARRSLQSHGRALGTDLEIDIREATSLDLLEAIAANDLEAALIMAPADDWHTLHPQCTLGQVEVCLIVKPDDSIAQHKQAVLQVLEGETLIVPARTSWLQSYVREHLQRQGVRPGIILQLSSPNAVRSAVLRGLGIGISIPEFVSSDVEAGLLRCISLDDASLTMRVLLVSQNLHTLHPLQRYVLEQLQNLEPTPAELNSTPASNSL